MFGKLLEAALKTVTLPIDVVKDLSGYTALIEDSEESSTFRKMREIAEDIDEIGD